MKCDNPDRVDALFRRICDLGAKERGAILDRECAGDARLREQVESLVRHYRDTSADEQALAGMQDVAGRAAAESLYEEIGEGIPKYIKGYHLLGIVGEGGMGIVYRAEQEDPRRWVAIKVLRVARSHSGGDTDAQATRLLARFDREKQVLALLTHPGIAQIFDAGVLQTTTQELRPYFVMEYIEGKGLVESARDLDLRQRLSRFIKICDAVEHAHQRGVVHRDLKPANVRVTTDGDPKVLDFGVARLMEAHGQTPVVSQEGQWIGTFPYMSPEQCEGHVGGVDARSDVYALGVLGFELLAGRVPYDIERKCFAELARTIREDDPIPMRAVLPACDRDLETVFAKAMGKEPSSRYFSAAAFANDIRSYLAGEPIVARPPSQVDRWRRQIKNNSVPLAAITSVFLVVVLALAVTSKLYFAKATLAKTKESIASNLLRLSDTRRIDNAIADADGMWPAYPDVIPRYESWLAQASALTGRNDEHLATLNRLRERALPWSEEERREDRESHPAYIRWSTLRDELTQVEADRDRLAAELELPQTWTFLNADRAAAQDQLVELLATLSKLDDPVDGWLADARRYQALADGKWRELWSADTEEWAAAIAAIADRQRSPAYGGLRIEPQLGLVPLGQNASTGLWEFWHVASGARPAPVDSGGFDVTPESGIVMVLIPAQRTWIGAQANDPSGPMFDLSARFEESPIEVVLAPYFISKYELTQGEWWRTSGELPEPRSPDAYMPGLSRELLTHPIARVDWLMARGVLEGVGLTLPSEAQWEVAARAGTTTRWSTGDARESLIGAANLADRTTARASESWASIAAWPELDDGFAYPAPVDALSPNRFGLHHVHGNVREWCRDRYGSYRLPTRGGDGLRTGQWYNRRILRGGSYESTAESLRSAFRAHDVETQVLSNVGVRAARPLTHSVDWERELEGAVLTGSDGSATALRDVHAWVARAESLWLAPSPQIASWIAHVEPLVARREEYEAELSSLRSRSVRGVATTQAERERHPRWLEWNEAVRRIEGAKAKLAALGEELGDRRTYSFANTEDAWWYGELELLVKSLETLTKPEGLIGDVTRRLEFATTVAEATTDGVEARRRWQEAIASIANREECPLYDGLKIEPQLGLFPLGRDPKSNLWEFAHVQSGVIPQRDSLSGSLQMGEESCIVLVLIPGGTHAMGEQKEDPDQLNYVPEPELDCQPGHEILLDPFFLGKYETTQAQWKRVTGTNPSFYEAARQTAIGSPRVTSLHPVESIVWLDAARTLRRLGLELPTEAQWEYACRARLAADWSSDDPFSLRGAANYQDIHFLMSNGDRLDPEVRTDADGYGLHAPAFGMRPNLFGLHHMLGNVCEWCRDVHGSYLLAVRSGDGERIAAHLREGANERYRIARGGDFRCELKTLRPSWRRYAAENAVLDNVGVRAARRIDSITN